MKDNFDLKKFLKESKAIENLNPSLKSINEKEDKSLKENSLKSKIREMIIDELSEESVSVGGDVSGTYEPVAPITPASNKDYDFLSESDDLHELGPDDDAPISDEHLQQMIDAGMIKFSDGTRPKNVDDFKARRNKIKGGLKEAEKDEDGEEKETESRKERADVDKFEFEKGKEAGEEEKEGGLEAIAADLDGTEQDLMGNLMNALKIAKGMDNEKLEVQIGNTLKFFVSTYIDKEENIRESINEQFTMGQKISGFLGKAVRSIKNMNKSVDGKTISDFMKREGLDPNGFNAYSVQMMSNEQEEEGKYSLTSPKLNPRKMVKVTQYQIDEMKNLGPGKGRGFVAKQIQVNLSDNIVKMEGKEYILNFMTGNYEFTGRKRDNVNVNDLPLHTDEDTEDLKKQTEKPFSISIEDLRTRLGL
jgi:hypothetical protein